MSDIAANITLKDNSAEVKRILKSAVKRGLKAIGIAAEGHADVGRFAWETPLKFAENHAAG